MSQQVNLLNPRLQRRRDLLSLALVVGAVLAVLLVGTGLAMFAGWQEKTLLAQANALQAQNKNIQIEVETTRKLLAERKPNADLAAQIGRFHAMLGSREEALNKLRSMTTADSSFANIFRGFARQAMEGVWLTDFAASASDLTIRGRLSDSALLPAYVRRLNAEPALSGRRFLALDMKGIEPVPEKALPGTSANGDAQAAAVLPPYVEFALQGVLLPATGGTGGGQ